MKGRFFIPDWSERKRTFLTLKLAGLSESDEPLRIEKEEPCEEGCYVTVEHDALTKPIRQELGIDRKRITPGENWPWQLNQLQHPKIHIVEEVKIESGKKSYVITYPNELTVPIQQTLACTTRPEEISEKDLKVSYSFMREYLRTNPMKLSEEIQSRIATQYQNDSAQQKNLVFCDFLKRLLMEKGNLEKSLLEWITYSFYLFELEGDLPYKQILDWLISSGFPFNDLFDDITFLNDKKLPLKNSLWHYLIAFEDPYLLSLLQVLDQNASSEAQKLKSEINQLKDGLGQTPLILLARMPNPRQIPVAKLLIKFGKVSLSVQDNQGKTAIYYALCNGSAELLELLAESYPADFTRAITTENQSGLSLIKLAEVFRKQSDQKIKKIIMAALYLVQIDPHRSQDANNSFLSIAKKTGMPHIKSTFARSGGVKLTYDYRIIMSCPCCQGGAKTHHMLLMHPTAGLQSLQQAFQEGQLFNIDFNIEKYIVGPENNNQMPKTFTPADMLAIESILKELSPTTLLEKCAHNFRVGCEVVLQKPVKSQLSRLSNPSTLYGKKRSSGGGASGGLSETPSPMLGTV